MFLKKEIYAKSTYFSYKQQTFVYTMKHFSGIITFWKNAYLSILNFLLVMLESLLKSLLLKFSTSVWHFYNYTNKSLLKNASQPGCKISMYKSCLFSFEVLDEANGFLLEEPINSTHNHLFMGLSQL